MSPTLTLVVPCYNSQEYMQVSIDSLLKPGYPDIEVIIVNDGSIDDTARIADEIQAAHPDRVKVVHKVNGGHGSAINAGLAAATGTYFKVLDSDDWLDPDAYQEVMTLLRKLGSEDRELDLLVTNFVYEKQGKRNKRSVHYRHALPRNQIFGWKQARSFWTWQYMLMHSMIYRTELLRECDLRVPEHSFYVDNYFAFVPLPQVHRIGYLDVDLYRYFIGRDDQSVNEKVMIGRIDQQINVNMLMVKHLSQARKDMTLPASLERYMTRYATLVTAVSSVLLLRDGSPNSLEKKNQIWRDIEAIDPDLSKELRKPLVGWVVSRDTKLTRFAMRVGYHASKILVGFN